MVRGTLMRKAILRASTFGCKLVEQYDSKPKAHNLPQRQTIYSLGLHCLEWWPRATMHLTTKSIKCSIQIEIAHETSKTVIWSKILIIFNINYMLKWYLVMSCLLFKSSDVLLGKQSYVVLLYSIVHVLS